ncbi:MAG: oxidoreductase, partial [Nitrospiraceae bacterium]
MAREKTPEADKPMGVKLIQVDAFTEEPFKGNPAVVCILPGPQGPSWMQQVAQETRATATAFLYRQPDGFNLRWFTPIIEIDLCGHATLAAAHVLYEEDCVKPGRPVRFFTRSGVMAATRIGQWIELDFPALHEEPAMPPLEMGKALGASWTYVGRNRFDYLLEADSEQAVRSLTPDYG